MKHLFLIFVIFLGINITSFSQALPQPQTEKTYTEMFDSVFSVVSKAQATTSVLYERVFPFANLASPTMDTSNYARFIQVF